MAISNNHSNFGARPKEQESQPDISLQSLCDAYAFTGHEWRNQITLLAVDAENLLREIHGPLTPQQATIVKRIRQSATAMGRIAHTFLSLARMMDPTFAIRPSKVDLVQDVLEPILHSYAGYLAKRGLTYQMKIDRPDTLVWADPDLLTSIYDNLLNNAIKYGEPGGKIIFGLSAQGSADEFSVWNSGPGVNPEQLELIFNRFANGSEAVGQPSTGIGLYLVHKIVEAHGGRLWVKSQPGGWANFIFTLPKGTINAAPDCPMPSRRKSNESEDIGRG